MPEVRVFLVEDLHSMRTLVDDLFAVIGGLRLVGAAKTEAEAKLWMDDNTGGWDLAIVDLVLDQGSGIEVVSYAKRNWPHLDVVVFSSYATPGVSAHCRNLGADAVFDKTQTIPFIQWLQDRTVGKPPLP